MRAWRSSVRRRGSSSRARRRSPFSRPTILTRSKLGSLRAKDRARAACAIWPRRCRSASRRVSSACFLSSTGGRPASLSAAPASPQRRARHCSLCRFRPWEPRASSFTTAPRSDDPAPPDFGRSPPPKSRFLWTLDEEGRFGAAHPALAAALGANAPHRGETVEALLGRAELEGGDELVGVIARRQTFSDVMVGWPLAGGARRRLVALSAAPLFGRHREFLGYRGFGVLGEEIDAPRPQRTGLALEPVEGATFEPDRAPSLTPRPSRPAPKRRRRGTTRPWRRPSRLRPSRTAQRRRSRPTSRRSMTSLQPSPTAAAPPPKSSKRISRLLQPTISKLRRRARPPSRLMEASRRRRRPRRARPAPRSHTFRSRNRPSGPPRAGLSRPRPTVARRFTSFAIRRRPPCPRSFRSAPARSTRCRCASRRRARLPKAWSSAGASAMLSARSRVRWSAGRPRRTMNGPAKSRPSIRSRPRAACWTWLSARRMSRRRRRKPSSPRPAALTTRRFNATPAAFSIGCRSARWWRATRARSMPTGRFSISSAIAISRPFRRPTG